MRHTGPQPQASRPQAGLLLTRASLALDRLVAGEGEGSLAEMFRLALTDFPQWSPTALSIDPPIVQACRLATAWAPLGHRMGTT